MLILACTVGLLALSWFPIISLANASTVWSEFGTGPGGSGQAASKSAAKSL